MVEILRAACLRPVGKRRSPQNDKFFLMWGGNASVVWASGRSGEQDSPNSEVGDVEEDGCADVRDAASGNGMRGGGWELAEQRAGCGPKADQPVCRAGGCDCGREASVWGPLREMSRTGRFGERQTAESEERASAARGGRGDLLAVEERQSPKRNADVGLAAGANAMANHRFREKPRASEWYGNQQTRG